MSAWVDEQKYGKEC